MLQSIVERLPPGFSPPLSVTVDRLYSVISGGSEARGVRRFHMLYQGSTRLMRTLDATELLDALDDDLKLYVARWAKACLCIHAGAVGWKGSGIVMPGGSHSGKTTLVEAFLRAGATYYSDDCAFIDDHGFVHPFATALSIRNNPTAPSRKVTSGELGATDGVEPIPIRLVVLASYRKGARWRPRSLSPGRAVVTLIRHSAGIRDNPRPSLDRLQRMILNARVISGVRGDAAGVCRELLDELWNPDKADLVASLA